MNQCAFHYSIQYGIRHPIQHTNRCCNNTVFSHAIDPRSFADWPQSCGHRLCVVAPYDADAQMAYTTHIAGECHVGHLSVGLS
jgi:hypothetical protein